MRGWLVVVLVLLPLAGCRQNLTAEQTLQTFVEAANARDFATAEALLTPRLLHGIPPGSLDRSWPSAETTTLTQIQAVGNTALYRLDAVLTPEAVLPTLSLPLTVEELRTFLTAPDRQDRRFQLLKAQLAFYDPLPDGRLRSAMDITLYRRPEGWRIELAQLHLLNSKVLHEPVELAKESQPFRLTGVVRLLNRAEGWIGVNLEEVSDSLQRYAGSWVAVVPGQNAIVTRLGRPVSWLELQPGDAVEMEGQVRFAVAADAEGRIPAAITAKRIRAFVKEGR